MTDKDSEILKTLEMKLIRIECDLDSLRKTIHEINLTLVGLDERFKERVPKRRE